MLPLTQEAIMDLLMNFLFYFVIGSFGAFLKDLYETLTKKEEKIRLSEVLIGGACATFVCYGLQDTWLKDLSINLIVLITFICGMLGFEIFGNLTTISRFRQFVLMIMDLKDRITIRPKNYSELPPIEIPQTIATEETSTTETSYEDTESSEEEVSQMSMESVKQKK